jgi:hypothetical protein
MFSLKMIRALLDKSQIPYEVGPAASAASSKDPVSRAAAKAGPSIVAMVDSFSELPTELQDYLLRAGNVRSTSPDRAKSLIIGGKKR